ncbi:hypothetical protein [Microbispora sp. CA-102843]|uniref:hypothetical protein n=1 Tax=Microbispora sp. CA-102843 TaxID=3239952 RepID=UPI003D8A132F
MSDRTAKIELSEAFASVGKALASGKRPELVDLPARGERSVEALAQAAGLRLTTASNHLQVPYCVLAHEAVRALTARGRPAARLAEGMLEWRLADLPVATGVTA